MPLEILEVHFDCATGPRILWQAQHFGHGGDLRRALSSGQVQ